MIVPGQQNLKVHFAAVEHVYQFVSATAAGCNYQLMTAFPLIAHKAGIKAIDMKANLRQVDIPPMVAKATKHSILDSGLFTLMFGGHKGDKDLKFISKWYSLLTEFIKESGYPGTCVEVDCQKVLGVSAAWDFRRRMAKGLPNRIINVFHAEDGQKGLDELIEFSDYLAISVPELRFAGKKGYVERLANYIKNRKPGIDIHLLGCTELKMLKAMKFCSTSDSSSWTSCVRYGWFDTPDGKFHVSRVKNEMLGKYTQAVRDTCATYGIEMKNEARASLMAFQAHQLKQRYALYAGDQT